MLFICAVRFAQGWTAANIAGGLLLLVAVLAAIAFAIRVTHRR